MTEEHVFDLLPGYALGILDEEELLTAAGHLSHCAVCRRELESYTEAVDGLVYTVSPAAPAPDLKAKVVQRVEESTRLAAPAARQADSAAGQNAPSAWWAAVLALFGSRTGLVLGGLALLVFLLGVNNFFLWQQVSDLQARMPAEGVRIVQMEGTEYAPDALGYLMVFENDDYGSLTVEHVPALEAGYQYQIWLIKNGQRASGGVFSVDEGGYGVLQIDADQPLNAFDSFGITIEPAGGSPGPTGQKILGGDL